MKTRVQIILLLSVGIIALGLGSAIFLQPKMTHEILAKQTETLVEKIEQGDGIVTLEKSIQDETVDFYEQPDEFDQISLDDLPVSNRDQAPVIIEPPQGEITGIGVLKIGKIDLKMPVSYGAGSEQLKIAAGWIPQTATIGSYGNAVIAGHRNYTYGSHFNRLGEMAVGDEIQYTSASGEVMKFIAIEILEVLPSDPIAFEQTDDVQMLTLYTCTPIHTATHRLLIRCTRVS